MSTKEKTKGYVRCNSCWALLPGTLYNTGKPGPCPRCKAKALVKVYSTLYAKREEMQLGQPLDDKTQASCSIHANKKAALTCPLCNKFMCSICDLEVGGKKICPVCAEKQRKHPTIPEFTTCEILPDQICLTLAVAPIILFWLTIITAPITLFLIFRWWRWQPKILKRSKIRFIAAGIIAFLQLAGWATFPFFSLWS